MQSISYENSIVIFFGFSLSNVGFSHFYMYSDGNFTGLAVTKHAYVNVHPAGSGLANLRWIESPMRHFTPTSAENVCRVSYAALNFRDIMLATGKLSAEAIPGITANFKSHKIKKIFQ